MKSGLFIALLCYCVVALQAQESKTATDSALQNRAVLLQDCPQELQPYINKDSLQTKAILLVFNEALHPLGRYEFFDAGKPVRYLHIPMRMKRCTLLYIDTGLHLFHTMYQQLKEPVHFDQGKIYMARLFSRAAWPLGGISVIRKNEKGEDVEYAAVLLEYINPAQAAELLPKMKSKEVLVNQ
jgi:hypothetical protein